MHHNDNRSPRELALRRLIARSATMLVGGVCLMLTMTWVGLIAYWLYMWF